MVNPRVKNLAYGIVDVLTVGRGVPRRIGGETIRFPPRLCRYYEAEYEPGTFRFLRQVLRPGDAALDVGAHIGLFTVVMARLVGPAGRVFSFEPTPTTRRVLERTVRLNRCSDRVEVRAEAVTRVSGRADFFDTGDVASNSNSLVASGRHRRQFSVDAVAVDEFLSARKLSVGFLKIDVEGAELDALRGAEQTLRRDRPAVALALHPDGVRRSGGSLHEIWRLLVDHRLAVTRFGAKVVESWFCRQQELFDVQCIPKES
jgi:FkbM family methyltransferase